MRPCAKKIQGRHSRNLQAESMNSMVGTPPPRLDAQLKTAGMTEFACGLWVAGLSPR
jgi:hypothetical protein